MAQQRRRRSSQTPSDQDARDDLLILGTLVGVLDGFDRASLLNGLPASEVAEWLRKRVVFYIAARAEGLVE